MARIIVVGGGIIGVCSALHLQRDGHAVTVVDRNAPGSGAAEASCGFIAVSEIIPLSRPGTLRRAPGWLCDPLGPLRIRPASALALLPWFLRFAANASPRRMQTIAGGLAALTANALADYQALLEPLGLRRLIGERPVLEVYEREIDFQRDRRYHAQRRAHGFCVDEITGAQVAELEPAIAGDFPRAVVYADWRAVTDIRRLVTALGDAFTGAGGEWVRDEVLDFAAAAGAVTGVRLTGGERGADQVVLAAGAWSPRLAARLGVPLSLAGVNGYQTLIPDPGVTLRHAVIHAAGGYAITPCASGLGIAGTIEFSGCDAAPDYRRAAVLVEQARRVLPGLRTGGGDVRAGCRPLCSDTLPVIDRLARAPNVLVATGHGQLGVTLGATTGKLIAQLAARRTPNIDLAPYSAARF